MAVIGAGRVGLALGRALRRSGHHLTGIVARRPAAARRVSRWAGRGVGTTDTARAIRTARAVLICVPDREIDTVTSGLAVLSLEHKVVLHTSGAIDSSPLAALRNRGATVGCLHPLTSFGPTCRLVPSFDGIAFALDGDDAALREARSMVRALRGEPLRVPASERAAYHLAATLLATDLVALLDTGFSLAARRLDITHDRARRAFMPLVRAVLDNVDAHGTRRGLTGSVTRGDKETVDRHLDALSHEEPDTSAAYRSLSRLAVLMAFSDGRIDRKTRTRLLEALTDPDAGV